MQNKKVTEVKTNEVPKNSTNNLDGESIKEVADSTPINLDKYRNGTTIITASFLLLDIPMAEMIVLVGLSMLPSIDYNVLHKITKLKKKRCKEVIIELIRRGYLTYEDSEICINTDLLYADFISGKNVKYAESFTKSGNLGSNPVHIKAIEDALIKEKKLTKNMNAHEIMLEDLTESRSKRAKENSLAAQAHKKLYKETNTVLRSVFKEYESDQTLDSVLTRLNITSEKQLYEVAVDLNTYPATSIIKGTYQFVEKLNADQLKTSNIFGLRHIWVGFVKNMESWLRDEVYKHMCSIDVNYPDKMTKITQIKAGSLDVGQDYIEKIGLCVDNTDGETPYLPDPVTELTYYDSYPLWGGDGHVRL